MPKGEEGNNGAEEIFEVIMAKIFFIDDRYQTTNLRNSEKKQVNQELYTEAYQIHAAQRQR